MWRPGAAIAALLLALVMTSLFDGRDQPRTSARPASPPSLNKANAISARDCGRAVIRDWADNREIDGSYARDCYVSALRLIPDDGRPPPTQELVDALITALKGPFGY